MDVIFLIVVDLVVIDTAVVDMVVLDVHNVREQVRYQQYHSALAARTTR